MVNWLGATWLLQQQPLNLSLGGRLRLYYAELIGPVFHLKRWQIKRWGAWRVVFACLAFKHPKGLTFYHSACLNVSSPKEGMSSFLITACEGHSQVGKSL